MTKEELDEDTLYGLVHTSYEFRMDGDIYRILGDNEEDVWIFREGDANACTLTYKELLSEIKTSGAPVEFLGLTKFASIV